MSLLFDWKEDFKTLFLNLKFEMLKTRKQSRLLLVSIIAIAMPFLFYIVPVIAGDPLPDTANELLSSIMGFVYLIMVLAAIFFCGDAVAVERYAKTALLIYPLPQKRTSIFLGKYISQLISSWFIVFLFYATSAAIVIYNYGIDELSEEMAKSILFAMVFMTALLSIAFFLSSIVKTPAGAMMLTFFLLFMLGPITNMILTGIDANTDWIITNYSGLITSVYRFPSQSFGPGAGGSVDFYEGVSLSLIYAGITGFLSWVFMMRQEV